MTDKNISKKTEWDRANLRTVSCRLRKEESEKFKAYAEYRGTTTNGLLAQYVRKCVTLGQNIPEPEKADVQELRTRIKLLTRKLELAVEAKTVAEERAARAEALVDKWLRSADN